MLAVIRRKLTRAESVRAFNRRNPSTDPAVVGLVAQLDQQYDRALALIQVRGERDQAARGGTLRRGQIRRRLRSGLLRLFSRAGLAAAKAEPALETVFRPVRPRMTTLDFAASARSMIEATRTHVDALAAHGVSPAMVTEASALLDEYIALTEQAFVARNGRVQAGAELKAVTGDIMDVIARLDGFNRHRFAEDPELLAAWASAKAVIGPIAGRNGKPATEPEGGSPNPPGGDLKAAA